MIGENIKSILRAKGITQIELSAMTGITEASISRYVKGERVPRADNLKIIADALGVTTDVIVGESAFCKTCITCKHNHDCLGISIINGNRIDRYKEPSAYCYLWESDNQ